MILPNRDILFEVEPEFAGQRLDRYLTRRIGHRSRSWLKGLIQSGLLQIVEVGPGNSRPLKVKPSTSVQAGMRILIKQSHKPRPHSESLVPRHPLKTLYEDDSLLVVDKPAGMLVHPAGSIYHETLIIQLKASTGLSDLHLGHRLDRETSGVLVVAKGHTSNRILKAAFHAREVRKGYLAVVHGQPSWTTEVCNVAIGSGNTQVRIRQAPRIDGSSAHTSFELVRHLGSSASLVACRPYTGRIHQIRVHLEHVGHPIVGDKIYGSDGSPFLRFRESGLTPELEAELGHWRQALHASWIEFEHPETGQRTQFNAPLAPDLVELVAELEAH